MMECILRDVSIKCVADFSDLRDLCTIRSRVKEEGLSFLTITLPQFCKDFERSLEQGFIDSTLFRNFKKARNQKKLAYPAFLQGMLSQIFDRETGRILNVKELSDPTHVALLVAGVRQICLVCKKLELPCTPERESAALDNYIEIERSFEMFALPREDKLAFSSVSSVLWDNLVGNLCLDMLSPKHGPGATAERISGNQKYIWRGWHDRLEPFFPLLGSAYPIGLTNMVGARFQTEFDLVSIISSGLEPPVRVTLVPKTLKSPRVIAIEPCCMQFAQQGIRGVLYDAIESYWLTAGHVNFTDQSINQSLARTSSADGLLATIDLSDASDRVPHDLAMTMFRANPDIQGAIEACRSTAAYLPDGRLVFPLRKFASMGSALCFPIEAMYFYTICVVASLRFHGLPVTYENTFKASRSIFIYGDDIIVPVDIATTVLDHLARYNCKVNSAKTFLTGMFRESCGTDAFMGVPVTPVYLRKLLPKNRQQASECVSNVASANQFAKAGYWHTASFLFSKVEEVLGPLPSVPEHSAGLGRNYLWRTAPRRWNSDFQCFEEKHWIASPVYRTDELDGYAALSKSLASLACTPKESRYAKLDVLRSLGLPSNSSISDEWLVKDPLHLERSALRGAVTLKRRWIQAPGAWFAE
jgi:hypothetical protein